MLITALNPHRRINDDYLDFLKLVAGQIASRLASAEAFDIERRRAAALAEAARMREEAAVALEQLNRQLASKAELRTARAGSASWAVPAAAKFHVHSARA